MPVGSCTSTMLCAGGRGGRRQEGVGGTPELSSAQVLRILRVWLCAGRPNSSWPWMCACPRDLTQRTMTTQKVPTKIICSHIAYHVQEHGAKLLCSPAPNPAPAVAYPPASIPKTTAASPQHTRQVRQKPWTSRRPPCPPPHPALASGGGAPRRPRAPRWPAA